MYRTGGVSNFRNRKNRNAAFYIYCYALGEQKPLLSAALQARFWRRQGFIPAPTKLGLIPNSVKMGFYCVTYNQNCTYEKTGRGGYSLAAASRLFIVQDCTIHYKP